MLQVVVGPLDDMLACADAPELCMLSALRQLGGWQRPQEGQILLARLSPGPKRLTESPREVRANSSTLDVTEVTPSVSGGAGFP